MPRVSEVIRDVLADASPFWSEAARELGTQVHRATAAYDRATDDAGRAAVLEQAARVERLRRKLDVYVTFLTESGFKPTKVEDQITGLQPLPYRGTLDRLGFFRDETTVTSLVDLKGSTAEDWHGVQLGAYAFAVDPALKLRRYSLYLSDDRYKLVERKSWDDVATFQAALRVWHWRHQHGQRLG